MWIFTSQGFISAVAHRDDPHLLLVRARRADHLEALFPGFTIEETPHADYRYRARVRREDVAHVLAGLALDLSYDNFKNSIADHEYHDACTGVWTVMHRLQPGSHYAGVTLAHEYGAVSLRASYAPGDASGYMIDRYPDDDDRQRARSLIAGTLQDCATCGIEFDDPEGRGQCPECDLDGQPPPF